MRTIISIIMAGAFCLLSFGTQAQEAPFVLDKIIAVVGGEILLKSELDENIALAESQSGTLPEGADCYVLNQLLTQKLLVNQAKLDSIPVSEGEVENQLNARFDQILAMMGNDPDQFEEYYGMTIPQAREKLRVDMRDQLLAQRMQRQIMENVRVTPSEVTAFFEGIPTDSLPYFNAEVEVGEIVHFPEPSEEERQRAQEKAEKLRTQIVDEGANFAELAQKHSDDLGSGRLGGDLGWQQRGQFVMEFEAAAFSLQPGEMSEVVESEFGFHIIQLLERLGNRIHTRHILVKPRITEEDMDAALAKLEEARSLISSDSISFTQAVKKYSTDKVQSFYNGGLMINPLHGQTFFETGELDVDVYFTIDTMQVGQIGTPFRFTNERGEEAFRMVKLISMAEPHQASLVMDYNKIKTAALEEKKTKELVRWVEETIRRTSITLDEDYHGCAILGIWRTNGNEENP
jgi:peptidyl-prolyl cis-trans isomerase SurA